MSKNSGRTQAARRSRSDRRLIAAALKLIAVKGADRTSMAEVGTAAGYSRALPGDRFGSKIGMLEAIVDNMSEWFRQQVESTRAAERGLAAAFTVQQPPTERRIKPRTPRDADPLVGDTVGLVVDPVSE